jgi:hypothetical protein
MSARAELIAHVGDQLSYRQIRSRPSFARRRGCADRCAVMPPLVDYHLTTAATPSWIQLQAGADNVACRRRHSSTAA